MPLIPRADVRTTEVQQWSGVHLLYFDGSLCVRKVVLVLALKGIKYTAKKVALAELRTPWFLGINPRGLVPALVHDGDVIIESNDIILHLEKAFPQPQLLPTDEMQAAKIVEILETQDAYHMDIRTLTFNSKFPAPMLTAMAKDKVTKLDEEDANGIKDINSAVGQGREAQRAFYESVATNGGITDAQVQESMANFRTVLVQFEQAYAQADFLVGDSLSLADVAVWVDVERLLNVAPAEFKLREEFPCLLAAHDRLAARVEGKLSTSGV